MYEAARKEAWYSGRPFPEDENKWYAFTNDCPHGLKEKERVRAEYREWYFDHSEWRLHATESLYVRESWVGGWENGTPFSRFT